MLLAPSSRSKTWSAFRANTGTRTTIGADASGPSRTNAGAVAAIADPSTVCGLCRWRCQ